MSALIGTTPDGPDDTAIRKGILLSGGSTFFPNKSAPFGVPKPSNDASNPYNGNSLQAAAATLMVLVILVTVGRFVVRIGFKNIKLGTDDFLIIPSALTAIAYCGLVLNLTSSGCLGRHVYFCTYQQMDFLHEIVYILQTIFYIIIYCAKISLLFLNRRITAFTNTWWTYVHWAVLAILVIFGVISFFTTMLSCQPVPAHYSLKELGKTQPGGFKCFSPSTLERIQTANRAFHISTDLILLSIPLIILYRLQMPLRTKLGIGFLFCFGVMCTVASIIRIVLYQHPTNDFTWNSSPIFMWDIIDLSFSCIVASLPTLYPILKIISSHTRSLMSRDNAPKSTSADPNAAPHGKGPYSDAMRSPTQARYPLAVHSKSKTLDTTFTDDIELIQTPSDEEAAPKHQH